MKKETLKVCHFCGEDIKGRTIKRKDLGENMRDSCVTCALDGKVKR